MMKHTSTLAALAFVLLGSVPSPAAGEAVIPAAGNLLQRQAAQTPFGHTGLLQRQHRLQAAASKGLQALTLAPVQGEDMQDFDNFGWLTVPTGETWYYTINLRRDDLNAGNPNATYHDYTVTGFALTVYDADANVVGKVDAEIPLLEGETRISQIDVCDLLTRKFFNVDNSYEVMVMVNANTPKYINNVRTYAFSLAADAAEGTSQPVAVVDGMMVSGINAAQDQWSENYFMIFDREGYAAPDGGFVAATAGTSADGVRGQRFTVFRKAGYSNPPVEVAHLDVSDDEANYNDGLPILVARRDNTLYIARTGYEKPFLLNPYDYEDMTITPDNHFFIALYSMPLSSYGTPTLTPLTTTRIPVEASSDEDVPLRFYGVGNLGYTDDMALSADGTPHYVVTLSDYHISTDGSFYSYYTYDADGSRTATIFENAEGRVSMSDVPGCPAQELFLRRAADDTYTFHFVNMDNYDEVLQLPAAFADNTLTTAIDRVPTADGSYEYAVRMGVTERDAEGRLCECISWFRPDGTFAHRRLLYLGSDVAVAAPNITGQTLCPFYVNTDDKREYMFLLQRYTGEGSKSRTELLILNDDGETVFHVAPTPDEGNISRVWTYGDAADGHLVITFLDPATDRYRAEVHPLPLTRFAGGSGTEADPYLIATAGDLQQMQNFPAAHYRLACDIDATQMVLKGSDATFSGTFDGNRKMIQNLRLKGTSCSLFGDVVGDADRTEPQIADFSVVNAALHPTGQGQCALLASSTLQHVGIENVHVFGLLADDEAFSGSFGGLVGTASVYTTIAGCSVNDARVSLPHAAVAGGIAAQLRTSSAIRACKVSGTLRADNTLGGIVGEVYENGSLCTVADNHVSADLEAQHTLGGIAGSDNHNLITHNYAEVTLTATGGDKWNGPCTGGIAGSLDEGMPAGVKRNVVGLRSLSSVASEVPENRPAVAYETTHRVVGKTTYNVYGDKADEGIADNYVLGTVAPISDATVYAGAFGAEGADLDSEGLTEAFMQTLGFAFGTEPDAPWTFTDAPALHFEHQVQGLMPVERLVEAAEGTVGHLAFRCAGGTAEEVTVDIPENTSIEVNYESSDGDTRLVVFDAVAPGEVTVTATCGSFSAQCTVRVTDGLQTAIAPVTSSCAPALREVSGHIVAADQAPIVLFDASGRRVATALGSVDLRALVPGVYVARSRETSLRVIVK